MEAQLTVVLLVPKMRTMGGKPGDASRINEIYQRAIIGKSEMRLTELLGCDPIVRYVDATEIQHELGSVRLTFTGYSKLEYVGGDGVSPIIGDNQRQGR